MKKLLTLLLALAMVLCLASCQYLPEDFQSAIDGAIDNVMGMLGGETTCEHDWIGATCTAPKTCSLCGATDGEANGHTEETVAGTAATCTEAGMTDGKKCSVCGETTVEQTAIAALGHTEEIVAGTAATCTEAGMTDGKKCSVCGVTTVEQTAIEALDHKAGEDDGDVTTAVTCERCDHVFVEAKEAITLTIPTFENGAVVADKMNYAIGDTVKLTVNPEWNYAQKLYINDEPLMLNWNDNVYSFVAEKDTYVISGSFEPTREMYAGDPTRWDNTNQAHGVITAYYPNNNDAWWYKIDGNYTSFAITAKNYRDIENSYEGGPDGGWRIALYMQLDNGKYYAFSMWINTDKVYAYNHFGGNIDGVASTTGWGGAWCLLSDKNAEATEALNGNGAEFKLERIDGNHIQITFGGIVLENYEIPDVTAENKVVSVGLLHYGNKGAYVDIPFALTDACDHTWVDATCTAPKTCSECGITMGGKLEHSFTNYVSDGDATCTEDGHKTAQCDNCEATDTKVDEGSKLNHKYDNGVETIAPTCTEKGLKTFTCQNDANHTYTEEIPANGHKDDDKNYKCDICEANLCTDHVEETIVGKDATCTENGLTDGKQCSICGSIMLAQEVINALGHKASADDGNCETAVKCANDGCDHIFVDAKNHTPEADDGDVTTAVKCTNEGCTQDAIPAKEAITLTISNFENGAVTADKMNYAIGDTVTLTIAPAGGYFQKLYINGEPLLLEWKTKTYSFVAEKDTYVIDGSFEPTLEVYAGDWGRWDNNNQAHGILSAYYPNNNDAWWYKIKGDYSSFAINAKNYREIANSYEGGPDGGWRIALYMQLDNGNYYAFSMWIDAGQKYAYNHYGGKIAGEKDSVTTWGGAWRDLAVVNPEATAALNGNGAEFKLERIDGNHIQVTFGGIVLETYEIPGVTAANKVVSVGLHHWGNKGAHVEIPFALTVPTVEPEPPVSEGDVTLNIGEFANGTVTADKGSYKVGETVTLTVSPDKDYAQKLYINGAPILVDTNSKYSFVVEAGKTYDITGEFVNVKGDWFWTAEYIVLNQAHGVFHSPIPAGGEKNGELVPTADKCYGGKILVKDPSGGTKKDYAIVLKMIFSDGQKAELRLVNKDGNGHYMIQSMSGMFGSWKWYYDLNDAENAAVASGDGVWFELVRDGSNINIMLNGKVIPHRADTPISLAESTVLNQFKVTTYNFSYAMDVKYEFYMAE